MHEHIRVWFENILSLIEKKDEGRAFEYLRRSLSFMLDESQRMDGFSLHMDRMLEEGVGCKVVKANEMPKANVHTEKDLLLSFSDLGKKNINRNSLLHIAAQHGMTGICDFLIKKGININALNSNQETPLMLALHNTAISGDQTCAGFLLDKGANPDIVSVHGWCALSITFYNSKASDLLRFMVLLLENNDRSGMIANPKIGPNSISGKLQPIIFAIIKNKKLATEQELMREALAAFLYYGGAIQPKDEIKMMRIFASTGNIQGLGLLSEYEYDIHKIIDDDRRTALHIGAYFGRLNFVSWLLNLGFDYSLSDRAGQTPARLAFSRNQITCGRLLMAYAFLEKQMAHCYQRQLMFQEKPKASIFASKSSQKLPWPCLHYSKLLQVILFKDLTGLQLSREVGFFRNNLKEFISILERLATVEMHQLKALKEKGEFSGSSFLGSLFSSSSKSKIGTKEEVFKVSAWLPLARGLQIELAKSNHKGAGAKANPLSIPKSFLSAFSSKSRNGETIPKEMDIV